MCHLRYARMSFKLVKKVIHSDRVDGMHKLVLIILADYVNETKGNAAWPSLTTVALQAGASIRHTRRIIRELEAEGVLKTQKQAGRYGTNKYVIDVDIPVDNSVRADTHVPPGADVQDIKGGHMRHVRADTHVPQTDKEQIRTNTFGGAPAPGQGATASLQRDHKNVATVGMAVAADTPQCDQHTTHYENQCDKCYAYQVHQWRKDPQ
jgi:hypothetical protein